MSVVITQEFAKVRILSTDVDSLTIAGGVQVTGPVLTTSLQGSATTATTTDQTPFNLWRGTTAPTVVYAKNYSNISVTLANGLVRATGLMSFYHFAPTDSDAAGIDRWASVNYVETGGSQPIGADIVGSLSRAIHYGTGSMATAGASIYGVQADVFNGHSGETTTTGGNAHNMIAVNAQAFMQSTNSSLTGAIYGVKSLVEIDAATSIPASYGFYSGFSGAVLPTVAYGYYCDAVLGTTKWSFYAADATAPNFFAGNVGINTATAPARPLEIGGTDPDMRFSGATGAGDKIEWKRNADTNTWAYIFAGGGGGTSDIRFFTRQGTFTTDTAPVEAMRILGTNGSVGIGTTTPNLSTSTVATTISAGTSGDVTAALEIQGNRTTSSGRIGSIWAYNGANPIARIDFSKDGTDVNSGNLLFTTYNTGSATVWWGVMKAGQFVGQSGLAFAWSNGAVQGGTVDTGFSRLGGGIIGVGNGTAGDFSGTLKTHSLIVTTPGAFVAGDKYLVVDASGNVHVSSLGPAS